MTATTPRLFCSSLVNCARGSSICSWLARPKLVKPLCLAHMMVLSPSRQAVIAQSVSQSLRFVCSSVYAGRWSKSGRTRASSGAAKARRAIARLGHDRLAAGCGFAVVGPGQVLRTCRARPSLGGGRQDAFPKATAGVSVRFPRRLGELLEAVLPFHLGPSGPSSQVAVAPLRQPN